jgi:hypothetical protein
VSQLREYDIDILATLVSFIDDDGTDPRQLPITNPIDHRSVCDINQITRAVPVPLPAYLIADSETGADMVGTNPAIVLKAQLLPNESRNSLCGSTPRFGNNNWSLLTKAEGSSSRRVHQSKRHKC